jgi:hypothetical protein
VSQATRQRTDYWAGEDDRWHVDDHLDHQVEAWLSTRFGRVGDDPSFGRLAVWLTVVMVSISCWVLVTAGAIRTLL